jgi:hypothetical protein
MESSWSESEHSLSKNSALKEEYEDMRRRVLPFWQGVFHYKDWKDESAKKKAMIKEKLKEQIIRSVDLMPTIGTYR